MKRNLNLKKDNLQKSLSDKIILYSIIGVAILSIIIVAVLIYSNKVKEEVKSGTMSLEEMTNIIEDTQSASTQMGKTVNEAQNTNSGTNTANTSNTMNAVTNTSTNTSKTNTSAKSSNTVANTTKQNTTTNAENTVKEENKEKAVELTFQKPVEGEVIKEYAQDNLVYSETLQEWVTHSGIDIKADKTTVVKSAEAGTIKSIKNDPRYGLTIVIDHGNNFQTVYSNLLTSEFVVEGEKVEKGQSIGTVGNTAVFEIADEPHLHFEILKDSLPVNPNEYIK